MTTSFKALKILLAGPYLRPLGRHLGESRIEHSKIPKAMLLGKWEYVSTLKQGLLASYQNYSYSYIITPQNNLA